MSSIKTSLPRPNRWLNEFSENVTSQLGEDGILEKVLEVINNSNRWCVEFGAWDGKHQSNTFNLIKNKGYAAILIEADGDRFRDLRKTFEGNHKVVPINASVGFNDENSLDAFLKSTRIPADFDLLSIDIDGNDYHVWDTVKDYRPKSVVIEYNPTITSTIEFVQPRDMHVNQGSSILSIVKLAKSKGYELVAVTGLNCIFVDSRYFELFGIRDNSIRVMRPNEPRVTHIFNGYDGTVFVRGYGKLDLHKIPYVESRMQQVPAWLREYPGDYGRLKKAVAKLYRSLRERNII